MRAWRYWLSVLALVVGALPASAQSGDIRLVVNAANPATSVSRLLAEQLFLKQRTRWSDNSVVMAVDQVEKSGPRREFSRVVLRKDVTAVKSYWQQMIFSGRAVPPPELGGDAEVLAVVRANAGAIGYVSSGTTLGAGVKVLPVSGS